MVVLCLLDLLFQCPRVKDIEAVKFCLL